MPGKPQIYSVQQANALLPRLNVILARQAERMSAIESTIEQLRAMTPVAPPDLHPHPEDPPRLAEIKARLRNLIAAFRSDWETVEGLGVVVKDVRLGLVDFYGERDGELVWLCWRYGEPAVAYWHPLDQDASARRPLEAVEIPRTLN